MGLLQATLVVAVGAPGFVFAFFGLLWLGGRTPSERALSRVTGITFSASILGFAAIAVVLVSSKSSVTVVFGNWFAVHDYRFPLILMADRLSLPFLAMTAVLSGLIENQSAIVTRMLGLSCAKSGSALSGRNSA